MTTILAVHGTYSFDSESGTKWFQKGSPFEARLRELIEPESGSLTYQPFIWDGENSETSRRAAAAALLVKMQALEAKGEPYSVIGHSHGGSIIATALMDSAARKSKLEHLKCWLTVGTPFITTTKEWSLFNRLGVLGRSFYVALLTCAMMFFLADNRQNAERFAGAHFFQLIGEVLMVATPFILFYLFMRYRSNRGLSIYNNGTIKWAVAHFQPRWRSLWHPNDEAIQSLTSLKAIKIELFRPQFAANALRFPAVLILPVLIVALVNSPDSMQYIYRQSVHGIGYTTAPAADWPIAKRDCIPQSNHETCKKLADAGLVYKPDERTKPDGLIEDGKDVQTNIRFLADIVRYGLDWIPSFRMTEIFERARTDVNKNAFDKDPVAHMKFYAIYVYGMSVVALVVLGLSYLIITAWGAVARLLSRGLSLVLNPMTTQQIRAVGFGSDTRTDLAVDAGTWPMWLGKGYKHLPEALGAEMQATSDAAVSKVVPKFRSALGKLVSATGQERSDMLSAYLTWEELIHTSYFNNERFRKLIALALAEAKGFRATEALVRDADYELVTTWHRDAFPQRV